MFCANCGHALKPVEDILSQNLDGGDFYTHHCEGCDTYWHLHLTGSEVVLMATKSDQPASNRIKDDLKIELSERIFKL